jgi:hypothetical protein
MLRLAGFDALAVRSIRKPDRIAVLARNVQLSELRDVPETWRSTKRNF